jgi:hypothetical protein
VAEAGSEVRLSCHLACPTVQASGDETHAAHITPRYERNAQVKPEAFSPPA